MRQSVNAKASLTARMTVRAVTKVGVSDPAVLAMGDGRRAAAAMHEKLK